VEDVDYTGKESFSWWLVELLEEEVFRVKETVGRKLEKSFSQRVFHNSIEM